jgi:hypothetical protein
VRGVPEGLYVRQEEWVQVAGSKIGSMGLRRTKFGDRFDLF